MACRKEPSPSSNGQGRSAADADALWAFAPDGTILGIVATPRALQLTEGGLVAIRKLVQTAPELAVLEQAARGRARLDRGGGPVTSLADLGLSHDRGAATFVTNNGDGGLVIVPVADRDKFLARVGGQRGTASDTIGELTCKPIKDLLRVREARGDVRPRSARVPTLASSSTSSRRAATSRSPRTASCRSASLEGLAVVAQLERGAIVLRGAIQGVRRSP